jgi:hypothetical protein
LKITPAVAAGITDHVWCQRQHKTDPFLSELGKIKLTPPCPLVELISTLEVAQAAGSLLSGMSTPAFFLSFSR